MAKTIYVLLIAMTITLACNQNKKEVSENNETENDSLVDADTTSETTSESVDVTWGNLPDKWDMITNKDEKFIRYRPCDAENPYVMIDKKQMKLYVNWGQDGEVQKILKWKYEQKPFKDEVEHYFYFDVDSEYDGKKEVILNYDPNGGVSSWSNLSAADGPVLYAPETDSAKYPLVKQPCRECFGEEECAGKE